MLPLRSHWSNLNSNDELFEKNEKSFFSRFGKLWYDWYDGLTEMLPSCKIKENKSISCYFINSEGLILWTCSDII